MSDSFALAPDRRIDLVSDMFAAKPEEFRVGSSRRLVELAREPGNNVFPDSPFVAGLAAAAKFEPALDADMLAETYARLSMASTDREFETMTGRDVGRLLVGFSRASEGIYDMENGIESDNAQAVQSVLNTFPDEKLSDIAGTLGEIVSNDMLLETTEAMDLDASVRMRDIDEVVYVRPHSSDIAQAQVLFEVINGRGEALGPIEPEFLDRNADVLVASSILWENNLAFERPVDQDMMIGVMANAVASREAGQQAGPEEFYGAAVLNEMASEIIMRQDAEELIAAYEDPSMVSDMRILDSITHLDEDGFRFFRAIELGRFDMLQVDDMAAIRGETSNMDNMPSEVLGFYEAMEEKVDQLRFAVMHDGHVNEIFAKQPEPQIEAEMAPATEAEKPRATEQEHPLVDAFLAETASEKSSFEPAKQDTALPAGPAAPGPAAPGPSVNSAAAASQSQQGPGL